MRNIDEIKQTSGIVIKKEGKDGFGGTVFPIEYKNGKVKIVKDIDKALHFMFSWGCGFEHLSVSTPIQCPTWEQMCKMKDIFWRDDEVCMQYCLHIWRPINQEIPMPPSIMVGLRKGKETEDLLDFLTFYDEMPKWE